MKKKGGNEEEVTLNVTAMLDMAFQLLAFFVLTFKQPPAEQQVFLKLPPAQLVIGNQNGQTADNNEQNKADPKPVKSLVVTLLDNGGGTTTEVHVGVPSVAMKQVPLKDVEPELRDWIQRQGFEQLVVQFSPTLHWEEVMKVVDMCAKLPTKEGKLPELSFACPGKRPED